MRQKLWRAVEPFAFSGFDRVAEVFRIPVDDDRSQQVETGHSVVLSFGGAVADFTLASNAQGIFQRVMRLAFVQADLGAALHVNVEQPVHDEKGALDAPDFSKRQGKLMLTRI